MSPMIFQLKLISRQTLKLGAQNQEDFGERVENQIGLESEKKVEFSSNLAN